MTNLKPCPFCGSPAKESFDEGRNQEWWIVCSNDDCDIFPTSACRVQEDARAWWNKRAAAPEGGLTVQEMNEAQDAARWRWLRKQKHADIAACWFLPPDVSLDQDDLNTPEQLDAAIDREIERDMNSGGT